VELVFHTGMKLFQDGFLSARIVRFDHPIYNVVKDAFVPCRMHYISRCTLKCRSERSPKRPRQASLLKSRNTFTALMEVELIRVGEICRPIEICEDFPPSVPRFLQLYLDWSPDHRLGSVDVTDTHSTSIIGRLVSASAWSKLYCAKGGE
jgi:hypothetical protein